MKNRRHKKAFPLSEFSILFSERVNSALRKNEAPQLLESYPNSFELEKILSIIRNSLRFIVHQDDLNVAHVIDRKQYIDVIDNLSDEKRKQSKRTGFNEETIKRLEMAEEAMDARTIVFVTDTVFYRMLIKVDGLDGLKRYIENYLDANMSSFSNERLRKEFLKLKQQEVSMLKLNVLISAVCKEFENVII